MHTWKFEVIQKISGEQVDLNAGKSDFLYKKNK